MTDISTVGMVLVSKSLALETLRRELSENASFGVGTLLVVEQSHLENRPRGVCMMYTVVYRSVSESPHLGELYTFTQTLTMRNKVKYA